MALKPRQSSKVKERMKPRWIIEVKMKHRTEIGRNKLGKNIVHGHTQCDLGVEVNGSVTLKSIMEVKRSIEVTGAR